MTTLTRYDNLEKAIADDDNKETISKSDVASVFPANDSYVYKLTASFSIPVTYKNCYFLEESKATPEKQVIDTINSTIYFGGKSISFAPIFSYTSSNYSTLNCFSDEYAVIGNVTSKSSVLYNKGNYKITNNTTEDVVESSYDYSLSTVVDNNQLLFALRNFEVDGSALGYLPTVSPAYGESKYLTIENESEYTLENISIKFNDHTITGNMPVKRYSYKLSDTTTTGFKQYLTIQREPVEGQSSPFEYRSLLTEYASPLISYGSISVMGALVYTLSSVQYS